MHQKKVIAIVVVSVIAIGIALGLALHVLRILAESKAVEISKQHPVFQSYLSQHPNAEHRVMKLYLESDGSVYTVYELGFDWELKHDWELKEYVGHGSKPGDGKDHYCWSVHWYDPTIVFPHIVNVCVDKDSWEIVSVEEVEEAW